MVSERYPDQKPTPAATPSVPLAVILFVRHCFILITCGQASDHRASILNVQLSRQPPHQHQHAQRLCQLSLCRLPSLLPIRPIGVLSPPSHRYRDALHTKP